jgi:hypothetical protein
MSQTPKPPNPFDPVEEAQISQMVNEGGREPSSPDAPPTKREPLIVEVPTVLSRIQNMLKLDSAVHTALDTFQRLDEGGAAQSLIVRTDGNHMSAKWVTPKKKP